MRRDDLVLCVQNRTDEAAWYQIVAEPRSQTGARWTQVWPKPMIPHRALGGPHEGEGFWDCRDDPRCRGMQAYGATAEG
jgi:hypothetical protein